ncbi:MAG TPA: rod-binding protein [Dongiaceae bacterium]|nr:rod-binding protein [Dongiaceae bacterium]
MASALATSGYPQIPAQQALAAYRSGRQLPGTAQSGAADLAKLDPKVVAAAHDAAQDFEAFFITHSFSEMASDIEPDSLFGGGEGEGIFKTMLYNEYGKLAAKTQGLGIADQVQRELLHLQELPPHE